MHSQRLNEPPLKPWVIVSSAGKVECAHCTCMAGVAETCTHVGALVEFAAQTRSLMCQHCVLPSNFSKIHPEVGYRIDYTSSVAQRKTLDQQINTQSTALAIRSQAQKRKTPPGGRGLLKVRLGGSLSRIVMVNGSDCELKEVVIVDGTGEISVTLWDSFVSQAEGGKSYSFKELSTRERREHPPVYWADKYHRADRRFRSARGGGGGGGDGSMALFSATIKGIEVMIQRECASCHFKQREFVEKSLTHRCERCNLKQYV
ncbi:hypothetical protein DPX16_0526 [Anabarilius grahami]|uniref:Uncharacterized protein n=1 Tax=Anabarilius grahami TaxID=495550 RepID=A0A3N0XLT0_ANAGA|nr:hypothetical protein DPX16_0526 [Anabarilius grahami]